MRLSRSERWTPLVLDVTLVLVLGALSVWLGTRVIDAVYRGNPKIDFVSSQARPLVAWAWVATSIQLAIILLCRRLPLVAWLVSSAMLIVHVVVISRLATLAPHPVGFAPLVPSDAVVLIALFTVTARRPRKIAVPVLVLTLTLAIYAAHAPLFGPRTTSGLLLAVLAAATFVAGLAGRSQTAYLSSLQQRAADLDRARIREAELAVINERSRLAREIHDTVAHALGIIVVQAQGAAAAQTRRPEQTRAALTAIIDVGRGALAEMRTLLSTETDDTGIRRAPLRGLGDVPTLVQQFRETGTPIDLDLSGNPDPLPPSIDHSLYRIVQEALTNAVKHTCADVRITVTISAQTDNIDVHIHNSGTRPSPNHSDDGTPGRGLNGMRERVAVLQGTLETGFDANGGFNVHAHLPTVENP